MDDRIIENAVVLQNSVTFIENIIYLFDVHQHLIAKHKIERRIFKWKRIS